MATARIATQAVMSTVTDTAQAVSAAVNTVAGGVHYVNDFVQDQRQKQLTRIAISNVGFKEKMLDEAKMDMVQRKKSIADFLSEDPNNKILWDQCETLFANI